MDLTARLRGWLAAPVDAAGVVWFRVIFGLVLVWEMARYIGHGWVTRYWVKPEILFPYWPFTFVRPWPEPFMTGHVVLVALAAAALAAGWRYRASAIVVFVGFSWLFLLDQTRYLNHFYLVSLLAFVLVCLPANRFASLDARSGRVPRSETTPAWSLWWVRFMVGVPYFFGGIAKIHWDWIKGEPMRDWLAGVSRDFPVVGALFETEPGVAFFVWGGLLFDLMVVPLLLIRRTRVIGLGLMLSFHLLNCRLFRIGIFPWMMMLATLVFLPPDWPRRVWRDLSGPDARKRMPLLLGGAAGLAIGLVMPSQPDPVNAVVAAVAVAVFAWEVDNYGWDFGRAALPEAREDRLMGRVPFAALAAFVAVQLLLPFRHLFVPGEVHWTEEGHRWSWHMKLRDKDVASAVVIVDPPGEEPPFEVNPKRYLRRHQYDKVLQTPNLTVMFAHALVEALDMPGAAVYIESEVTLNSRAPQLLLDPNQDLTQVSVPYLPPAPWILPLTEPLVVTFDD